MSPQNQPPRAAPAAPAAKYTGPAIVVGQTHVHISDRNLTGKVTKATYDTAGVLTMIDVEAEQQDNLGHPIVRRDVPVGAFTVLAAGDPPASTKAKDAPGGNPRV